MKDDLWNTWWTAWLLIVQWCWTWGEYLVLYLVPRKYTNKVVEHTHVPKPYEGMERKLVENGYRKDWETMLDEEFQRLRGTNKNEKVVYLDSAGASLYSQSQIQNLSLLLSQNVLRNPHSAAADDPRDELRKRCLLHCNASAEEYVCILTASATSGIQTAVQLIPWKEGDTFLYTRVCHTSLMGARNIALERGAHAYPVELSCNVCCHRTDQDGNERSSYPFEVDLELEGEHKQNNTASQRMQDQELKGTPAQHHTSSTMADRVCQSSVAEKARFHGKSRCVKQWTVLIEGSPMRRDNTAMHLGAGKKYKNHPESDSRASANSVPPPAWLPRTGSSAFTLLAFPHECNVTGLRTDLSVIDAAHAGSLVAQTKAVCGCEANGVHGCGEVAASASNLALKRASISEDVMVLLDAARSGGTLPPDLARHKPDFVVLSFYKIFGLPTSGGALLVRRETLNKLQNYVSLLHNEEASSRDFARPRAPECSKRETGSGKYLPLQSHARRILPKVSNDPKCQVLNAGDNQLYPALQKVEVSESCLFTEPAGQTSQPIVALEGDNSMRNDDAYDDRFPLTSEHCETGDRGTAFTQMAFGGGSLLACTPDRDCAIRRAVPEGLEAGTPDFIGHQAALIGFQHLEALGGSYALYQHTMALRNCALEHMSQMVHPNSNQPVFVLYGTNGLHSTSQLLSVQPHARNNGGSNTSASVKGSNKSKGSTAIEDKTTANKRFEGHPFVHQLCPSGTEPPVGSLIKPVSPLLDHRTSFSGVGSHNPYPCGPTIAFNVCQADGTLVGHNQFVFLAELNNIYVRGGRFCNPGAASKFWHVDLEELVSGCTAGLDCKAGGIEFIDGAPTGALRISFGYYNTMADLLNFFSFIEKNFLLSSSEDHGPKENSITTTSKAVVPLNITSKVTLKKIILYPIKSCHGQEVSQWYCKPGRGLLFDREWMLVDALGKPLSSKSVPNMRAILPFVDLDQKMLFVRVDRRIIRSNDIPTLGVVLQPEEVLSNPFPMRDTSFQTPLPADGIAFALHEDNPTVKEWFRKVLGEEIRLVRASHAQRSSYANRDDLHLISQQSVADLEDKINKYEQTKTRENRQKMNWQNFRPNFVVDGNHAYEEDKIQSYILPQGEKLRLEQLCIRCSGVNIGGKTKEPLYTLSQYRRTKSGVSFGVLLSFHGTLEQAAPCTVVCIGQQMRTVLK